MGVQDSHSHGSDGKEAECSSRFYLPIDILKLIIGCCFSSVDQIRFRAVCKDWRLAKPAEHNTKLPCGFWITDGILLVMVTFRVHAHSILRLHHISNDIIKDELQYNLHGTGICASKHGWLLLQKGKTPFFYNPLMKEVFKLPEMDLNFNRSTFSSVPTSPDCLCFSIASSKRSNKLCVSICAPGYNK